MGLGPAVGGVLSRGTGVEPPTSGSLYHLVEMYKATLPVELSALVRFVGAVRVDYRLWCWAGRDRRCSHPFDLTLISDQRQMRFPCVGQLMLTLLWKPSPGTMKRRHDERPS